MSECFCYVYVIYTPEMMVNNRHFVKIGISDFPHVRLSQLATSCPHRLKIDSQWAFSSREVARVVEAHLHARLDDVRTYGEWFILNVERVKFHVQKGIFDYFSDAEGDEKLRALALVACGFTPDLIEFFSKDPF